MKHLFTIIALTFALFSANIVSAQMSYRKAFQVTSLDNTGIQPQYELSDRDAKGLKHGQVIIFEMKNDVMDETTKVRAKIYVNSFGTTYALISIKDYMQVMEDDEATDVTALEFTADWEVKTIGIKKKAPASSSHPVLAHAQH